MSTFAADSPGSWIIRVEIAQAEKLGSLRSIVGLQVLVDDRFLWVRGDSLSDDSSRRIRAMPDAERFTVRLDGQLVRAGMTVPSAGMPEGSWQPLREWHELQLPHAGFAAESTSKVQLKLNRSSSVSPANLILTRWSIWFDYAQTAPQVRLNRWAFARSMDDRALILGAPPPPISGRRFVETHGVIIPNGWRLEPNVGPKVARQVLRLDESEMAMFSEDGTFERLGRSAFVQATRSTVRATNG